MAPPWRPPPAPLPAAGAEKQVEDLGRWGVSGGRGRGFPRRTPVGMGLVGFCWVGGILSCAELHGSWMNWWMMLLDRFRMFGFAVSEI